MIDPISLAASAELSDLIESNEATFLVVTLVSDSDRPVAKVAFDHRGGTRCHE